MSLRLINREKYTKGATILVVTKTDQQGKVKREAITFEVTQIDEQIKVQNRGYITLVAMETDNSKQK